MSLDLGEQDYDILTLGGAHTEEKNVYRRHLLGDSIVVESSRGTSSPQATPFLGIMRKETTEEQGEMSPVYVFLFCMRSPRVKIS